MKIIDERETQKKQQQQQQQETDQTKTGKRKGDRSYSERARGKWFYCAFK